MSADAPLIPWKGVTLYQQKARYVNHQPIRTNHDKPLDQQPQIDFK